MPIYIERRQKVVVLIAPSHGIGMSVAYIYLIDDLVIRSLSILSSSWFQWSTPCLYRL